jgi:rubrerythrin
MSTIDENTTSSPKPGMDRRRFLAFSGMAAGAGIALVACGDDSSGDIADGSAAGRTTTTAGGTSTTAGGGVQGDLAIAMGAAGLEVLAVNTYGAALDAATAGDLGQVPDAVAEFATTAKRQHQAALDAWNGVLTGAGEQEVTMPPADLEETVNQQFGQVTDVNGLAELANMLEQTASQTYLDAQTSLEGEDARALAGSIQVIDQQHSAILNFVLGEYPVPDVFQSTDMSVL